LWLRCRLRFPFREALRHQHFAQLSHFLARALRHHQREHRDDEREKSPHK
jgi:hypothetical protein